VPSTVAKKLLGKRKCPEVKQPPKKKQNNSSKKGLTGFEMVNMIERLIPYLR